MRHKLRTIKSWYSRSVHPEHYVPVRGSVSKQFVPLKKAFCRIQPMLAVKSRTTEIQGGSALVVYQHGKPVVELYFGNMLSNMPWQQNTLAMSFSCGKAVLATLVHILVSDAVLDYDVPIAHYWKAFAQNGKQNITLRQVLCHQDGLYNIRELIADIVLLENWQAMIERIAAMPVDTAAQKKSIYKAVTFGWIVGGCIEHATGKSLTDVLDEKLLKPLAIENDFFFGVPNSELNRVARFQVKKTISSTHQNFTADATKVAVLNEAQQAQSIERKAKISTKNKNNLGFNWLSQWVNHATKAGFTAYQHMRGINPDYFNQAVAPKGSGSYDFYSDNALMACAPSYNGAFTAKSMAKVYAMLANKGVWKDQVLIKPKVFLTATQMQPHLTNQGENSPLVDQVFMSHMYWRLGYHKVFSLNPLKNLKASKDNAFGHSGINGTMAWCDPKTGLAFCYVHNFKDVHLATDLRVHYLTDIARSCV